MGDLKNFCAEHFDSGFAGKACLEPRSPHTATRVGKKIYILGGYEEGRLSNSVQIFDTLTNEWITPMVLGTKPASLQGHSAVLVNNDRILIFKGGSAPNDNIWFLEVDTPFIKNQRQIKGTEVVAWSKGVIGETPQPVVISGPSGVGKGTLISKLMKEFPSTFGFSVSHTTRSPRENEKDGAHYHFTKRNLMEMEINEGNFLEFANVHGNLYGTSIAAVDSVADVGKRCILDIDVQGAKSVRNSGLDALFIFICPPSFEELEKRLRGRGTEMDEQIQKRLRNARAEIEQGRDTSRFDHILVNDDLEACYLRLKQILGLNKASSPSAAVNGVLQTSVNDVDLFTGHPASLSDQKVIIHGGTTAVGKASSSLFVLDISCLKGGAPGRTRSLKLYSVEPLADAFRDIKQISPSTDQLKNMISGIW